MKEKLKVFSNGLLKENPSLRLVLGTCPTLAVTTLAVNGLGMGLAATFVLVCSNIAISALRKIIPDKVRLPAYITVIATFVTVLQMLVKAFVPALDSALVFFSMILVNNYVLVQFLGICPFLGVSKKLDSAVGMSAAVIFVMALATSVTWPIYTYLLEPNDMAYLQTIVFILIIAVLVQLVEIILKKFMPPLYKALGVYLPLITTNCAVLGVTISVLDEGYNFAESLVCAVGAGVGFMVAMVLFSGVRKRLEDAQPPKCFEGLPITLVAASVTSLSFMGFGGVIENIFAGH